LQGVDLKYPSACRWWALAALAFAAHASAQSTDDAYSRSCASCHGPELRGGETGPALIGTAFQQRWGTQPSEELDHFIRRTVPPTSPGSLSDADYASTLARIRLANGWPAGTAAVAVSPGSGQKPTSVEWSNNRGDLGSTSYSPLDQINRDNFDKLRIAWRWKSDNFGPTPEFYFRATPLLADGVLYTSAGLRRDVIAIDATTGEELSHRSASRRLRCRQLARQ
jgi:quinoprotein glucose dehydrogenase